MFFGPSLYIDIHIIVIVTTIGDLKSIFSRTSEGKSYPLSKIDGYLTHIANRLKL